MATYTYNPKKVTVSLGSHTVKGYAEDSFVTVSPKYDGVTSKTGCDGEVVRAIDPSKQYTIQLTLLQSSDTNRWLQNKYNEDKDAGTGIFSILINDLTGKVKFSSDSCWISRAADRGYGRDTADRQWTLETGEGNMIQEPR